MNVSKRLNLFPEYIFSRLSKQASKNVLDLSIGSPDFAPSNIYMSKLKEYIDEPRSHMYPGYGAIPEFIEALQSWYAQRFYVRLGQNELYPLLGSRDGVAHLPLALCDEGDEILVPDPGYPAFSGPALMIGVKPVYYNLTIDIQELDKKVTSKTIYIWVNFPSNPTGQVTTLSELKLLVEFAKKHDIWLLYDNAYSEITFDGYIAPSILQINGAKDIAVELSSFSKTFSFAGFRMGWIVGNSKIISALSKVKSQMDSGMSIPLQKMAAYALTHPDHEWHTNMIESLIKRRDKMISYLKTLDLLAEKCLGGLYLWVKIPDNYPNSETYSTKLLEENQILVTPGTAFGKNGIRYIRVSFCGNIDSIGEYIKL